MPASSSQRSCAEPLVLEPVTVRLLRGDQVAQYPASVAATAQGEEGTAGFHEVARPHEVVAAAAVAGVAPRYRQARDERAGEASILVALDHRRGASQQRIFVGCEQRAHCRRRSHRRQPVVPFAAIRPPRSREAHRQRLQRECRRRLATARTSQGEYPGRCQPGGEGDLAGAGYVVVPGHRAVRVEVLPQVARPDASDRATQQRGCTVAVHRSDRQTEGPLRGHQHRAPDPVHLRGLVAGGVSAEPGCGQHVEFEVGWPGEGVVDQQHIAFGIDADLEHDVEARMAVVHHEGRDGAGDPVDRIACQAAQFHPEPVTVGDDEAEILELWNVRPGVVDLGNDALGHREPQARVAERGANAILPGGGPRRGGMRRARRLARRRSVVGHRGVSPPVSFSGLDPCPQHRFRSVAHRAAAYPTRLRNAGRGRARNCCARRG